MSPEAQNKRNLTLTPNPDDLKAIINRLLKDAFYCGFNAENEQAFWFFDGCAEAEKALSEFCQNIGSVEEDDKGGTDA